MHTVGCLPTSKYEAGQPAWRCSRLLTTMETIEGRPRRAIAVLGGPRCTRRACKNSRFACLRGCGRLPRAAHAYMQACIPCSSTAAALSAERTLTLACVPFAARLATPAVLP